MIQELIALLAVFAALVYTSIGIVNLFKKSEHACNCGTCDIKTEINKLKSVKKI